jgi:protein-arginine kinase activator protein McsA
MKPDTNLTCERCGVELDNRPAITVLGRVECFMCAKRNVLEIANNRREMAAVLYNKQLDEYQRLAREHEVALTKWSEELKSMMPSNGAAAFIGWCVRSIKGTDPLTEFKKTHPQPALAFRHPSPTRVEPVELHILERRHVAMQSRLNATRSAVLKRDKYVCQNCGNAKRETDLEAHHVKPRAAGGNDDLTNLATLCKECHDKETWFGHNRAYPTTKTQ